MDSCMGLSTQSVEAKAYATSASAIMNFEEEELDLMSCDELENYIGELHTLSKTTIKSKKGYTPAQQAWLVAAAIAKKGLSLCCNLHKTFCKKYTCSRNASV